jgi:hypothetical protein
MKAWLCPKCVPNEEFEELAIGALRQVTCYNCSQFVSGSEAVCVYTHTWEQWVKEGKIPRYGCSNCTEAAILADTEDWKRPVCYDCWHAMGEPDEEPPPFQVMGVDFDQPVFKLDK